MLDTEMKDSSSVKGRSLYYGGGHLNILTEGAKRSKPACGELCMASDIFRIPVNVL